MGAAAAAAGFRVGETVALRPDVSVPDWSGVHDPGARDALAASMAVAGRRTTWAGLSAEEDALRRAVLLGFACTGLAPGAAALGAAAGIGRDAVVSGLRALAARDLLVLEGDVVAACYPFCAPDFGGPGRAHRVRLAADGPWVAALCALDALGAGAMLGRDAEIGSACPVCGAHIRVLTCNAGRGLGLVVPAGAVVWSGIHYARGCAARSGCARKPFFCSAAHRDAWRSGTDGAGPGHALTVAAALQVGRALFGPMLSGSAPAEAASSAAPRAP